MNDYKVYMHRNKTNGKVYIGCTGQPLLKRFSGGRGYDRCTRFYDDIIKYGWDNFEHILIKDGMDRTEALAMEEAMVNEYDAMNPEKGYNMRQGGEHNIPCEEVGRHISEAKMGHEVTEETRAKLREYGKLAVVQIDLQGGVVNVFPSITEAAQSMGVVKQGIWAVCNGKRPTSRGYVWKYADEDQQLPQENPTP